MTTEVPFNTKDSMRLKANPVHNRRLHQSVPNLFLSLLLSTLLSFSHL